MVQIYIEDLSGHVEKEVTLKGWLFNKRSGGKIAFLILRDGSGMIQCVVSKSDISEEKFSLVDTITQESSISVTGIVKEDKRSDSGFELHVTDLKVYQIAEEYPITPKEHGTGFLMDNRHLWIRSRRQNAILKVRHTIIKACRNYLDDNGFTLVEHCRIYVNRDTT